MISAPKTNKQTFPFHIKKQVKTSMILTCFPSAAVTAEGFYKDYFASLSRYFIRT